MPARSQGLKSQTERLIGHIQHSAYQYEVISLEGPAFSGLWNNQSSLLPYTFCQSGKMSFSPILLSHWITGHPSIISWNRLQWSSEHSPRGLCSAAFLAPLAYFYRQDVLLKSLPAYLEISTFFLPCLLWWELTPLKSTSGSVSTRWILPETEASTSELFLLNNIGRHRYGGNPSLGWMHLFQSQVLGQKSSLYPPTHPAPTSKSMSLSHHLSTGYWSRYVLSLRG